MKLLDGVIVCVLPDFNSPAAQVFLGIGINTLIEKLPGLNSTETLKLNEAVNRTGALCMIGYNRRFNHVITEAGRLIEKG